MIQANFIIPAQPSRFGQPAEGSLNDPSLGQYLEAIGPVAPADNFQVQFAKGAQPFDPLNQRAEVTAVGPNDLQATKKAHQSLEERLGCVPVLHGSAGDHQRQNQAQGVHRQVALAAFDLFARVVAAFPGLIGRLDRLAVNNSCRRGDRPALALAQPVSQGVVDEGPGPILAPSAEVAINGLPGREVSGQKPPGATTTHDVEDRIHQDSASQGWTTPFAPAGFGFGHQRLDLLPFFISQIRWIILRMRLHPLYL